MSLAVFNQFERNDINSNKKMHLNDSKTQPRDLLNCLETITLMHFFHVVLEVLLVLKHFVTEVTHWVMAIP